MNVLITSLVLDIMNLRFPVLACYYLKEYHSVQHSYWSITFFLRIRHVTTYYRKSTNTILSPKKGETSFLLLVTCFFPRCLLFPVRYSRLSARCLLLSARCLLIFVCCLFFLLVTFFSLHNFVVWVFAFLAHFTNKQIRC